MKITMTMALDYDYDYDYDDNHERLTFLSLPYPHVLFHLWGATLGRYLEDFFGCPQVCQTFHLEASGIQSNEVTNG